MPLPANSAAVDALGLGGDLGQQVKDETEEERKKRMMQVQQMQSLGPSGSLAVSSIFGPMGGAGARY
jgi:hypothetical protein